MEKIRFDVLVHMHYPEYSRTAIQNFINAGQVLVENQVIIKPGIMIPTKAMVTLQAQKPIYVSRAGFKLAAALDRWQIKVQDLVCLDGGISTGGFTDCLLQRGAKRIYGVDVGHGQTESTLIADPRLILIEKKNLRYELHLPEYVDLVTLDLSFISVLKVMETVVRLIKSSSVLIILIKPQFELERHQIGRNGIVKNDKLHKIAVDKVVAGVCMHGFVLQGVMPSPVVGGDGNVEFLGYFTKDL